MPWATPFRSPALYAPTPMPIPAKITTRAAMIGIPRRMTNLLVSWSGSTMGRGCERLVKVVRRFLDRLSDVGGIDTPMVAVQGGAPELDVFGSQQREAHRATDPVGTGVREGRERVHRAPAAVRRGPLQDRRHRALPDPSTLE